MWWIGLCASAVAADADVLMLGNSYTASNGLKIRVAEQLVAQVPTWTDVYAESETTGGLSLSGHLARADGTLGDTRTRDLLVTGGYLWDHVVLQDQSQIPGFPEGTPDLEASQAALPDLDALIELAGAQTVLLLTWGRRDGDTLNPWLYPDFQTMQDLLTAGYIGYARSISRPGRTAWIAPAGPAFALVHGDVLAAGDEPTAVGSDFHALYKPDGSHPSPTGTFLVSAVVAATLTGRSSVDLGVMTDAGIDEDLRLYLEAVADRAVLGDPYGAFPFPWALQYTDLAGPVISGVGMRPLARVSGAALEPGSLRIAVHDPAGVAGDGRLLVDEGGSLTVGTLVVGETGAGEAEVRGSLDADEVVLAQLGGSGRLVVRGEAEVGAVRAGTGAAMVRLEAGMLAVGTLEAPFVQTAGRLSLRGPVLASTLIMEAGVFDATLGTVAAADSLALAGQLAWSGEAGLGRVEVARAGTVTTDALTLAGPHRASLELTRDGDEDVLAVTWDPSSMRIDVVGSCPGPVTLTVQGAPAGARVGLLSGHAGAEALGAGPCAGSEVDLSSTVLRATATADGAGLASFAPVLPEAACGMWVAAVDGTSCGVTGSQPLSW
jgi:hypothetical protein